MRVTLFNPGFWEDVIQALMDSGVEPRDVLRATLTARKIARKRRKRAGAPKSVLEGFDRPFARLEKLNSKYAEKDQRDVNLYGWKAKNGKRKRL